MQRDDGSFVQGLGTRESWVFLLLDNCSFLRPGIVKQRLVAQLRLIIQEQKLPVAPALLQHSSCSFPPSRIPRTAERLKVRFKQAWSSARLQSRP